MTAELKPTLYELIELNMITLSQTNPRTYFNKEAMAELTDSIRRHGVLQPILVRPMKHGGYEVVAGHRRYPKNSFSSDSVEFGLSELLFGLIRGRNPTCKTPNMQAWARTGWSGYQLIYIYIKEKDWPGLKVIL